jgi:Ca2+-binding RTX toxin-like protein
VVLSQIDGMTIGVTDSGAVIAPGRGCRSVDAHAASCSVAGLSGYNGLIGATVQAGDMDDIVDSQGPGLSGTGGPGGDTLSSSSVVAGSLDGGSGRDTLLGGSNTDILSDGDQSGRVDSDVLDGREGGAVVSYASRTAPVRVDLDDPGPDGEAGEGDILRSVRGVTGGHGADHLVGDGGPNWLTGGPGADRLYGRGGDDYLDGGRGPDRLIAKDGDDILLGGSGRDVAQGGDGLDSLDGGAGRDRLRGGRGQDFLASGSAWCGHGPDSARPAAGDYVAPDCEDVGFALPLRKGDYADAKSVTARPYPVRQGATALVFRVQCPHTETDGYPDGIEMRGRLRLSTSDGRLLGTGRIPEDGEACGGLGFYEDSSELPWIRIRATLTPAGRAVLQGRRSTRVTVHFVGQNVPPVPWVIRIPRRDTK